MRDGGVRGSAKCSGSASRHDELVAAGADPLKPTLLVDAAIDKLQLELYLLKSDDPALKGAHALFDEQSGKICCEKVDDPGDRALLIASSIHDFRRAGKKSGKLS